MTPNQILGPEIFDQYIKYNFKPHKWFLTIAFVYNVSMCACTSAPKAFT